MKEEAIKALKVLLAQSKLKEDFYAKVREKTKLRVDVYLERKQAIYAVRSIIDLYDDSAYAKLAEKWDEIVVVRRFSDSVNYYIDKYGANRTLTVIRELQKKGEWVIPNELKKIRVTNSPLNTDKPKLAGLKVVGKLVDGKIVSPNQELEVLIKPTEEPKVTPKPKTKAVMPIVTDDDSYEILDFGGHNRSGSLDEYHIRVCCKDGNKYVALNSEISKNFSYGDDVYAYIRMDKITQQLFIVISSECTPNSISCKFKSKTGNTLYISNKKLAVFLSEKYRLGEFGDLHVSKNRSKVDGVVTVEILGD